MEQIKTFLWHGYDAILKRSGKAPDTVVVGTHLRAVAVAEALEELQLDLHIVEDYALGAKTIWLTHSDDMDQFRESIEN